MTDLALTNSESETREVAKDLVKRLVAGTTILLCGDLGAGKTAFVKGMAAGLGISTDDVTSPTFTLVHEYRGGHLPLVHIDLYRLEQADLDELGVDSELTAASVTAIEWPERLSRPPAGAITVRIDDAGGDRRTIRIQGERLAEDQPLAPGA